MIKPTIPKTDGERIVEAVIGKRLKRYDRIVLAQRIDAIIRISVSHERHRCMCLAREAFAKIGTVDE